MPKIPVSELPVIGWREWVSLPDFKISKIKAKVDSGARTSSLHAYDIRYTRKGEKSFVYFKVHPIQKDFKTTVECKAEIIQKRKIKSSNGFVEIRPIIRTKILLMEEVFEIEISLARRTDMGFRMLLGREATRNRFNTATGVSFVDKRLVSQKVRLKKKSKTKRKIEGVRT